MSRPLFAALMVILGPAGVPGQTPANPVEFLAKTEADLARVRDLRTKQLATDLEVLSAELRADRARAWVARSDGDAEAEVKHLTAGIAHGETLAGRIEKLLAAGLLAAEEGDVVQRDLRLAKIELAQVKGEKVRAVRLWREVLGIEEKRLARAKAIADRGALHPAEMRDREAAVERARKGLAAAEAAAAL